MSDLSVEELNAHISRRALETLNPPRARRRPPVSTLVDIPAPPPAPGSLEEHLAAAKANRIENPEKTRVLDECYRQLDILNLDGWNFRIRDTHHLNRAGVHVDQLELNRVVLETLGRKIQEVITGREKR